ncbi:chemotaxis response regulator protein-glutamate methylesterase [Myxococcota bacterium]|nr:chemotaxis response regulator protein-glutamate methylesterase [Myxococcota bacterium]
MIRALVVDDSAVVRRAIIQALSKDPEIQVVGAAPDPFVARELIAAEDPDVITLDLEMPRMDGLTFLKHLMKHHPVPTIIISSLSQGGRKLAVEALAAGAFDVVTKPDGPGALGELARVLSEKVRAAAGVDPARLAAAHPSALATGSLPRVGATADLVTGSLSQTTGSLGHAPAAAHSPARGHFSKILAIGASTGGTVAIERVLRELPADAPPTLIVQHMPVGFTKSFADRLHETVAMDVQEATDGVELRRGLALIAPGNRHLVLRLEGGRLLARLSDAPLVNRHRPSVDVLFESVAEVGVTAIAALLTGMGADGASGLLSLKKKGTRTIVQDQESCVVFGMPRVAIELGAADEVLPLDQIGGRLTTLSTLRQGEN